MLTGPIPSSIGLKVLRNLELFSNALTIDHRRSESIAGLIIVFECSDGTYPIDRQGSEIVAVHFLVRKLFDGLFHHGSMTC